MSFAGSAVQDRQRIESIVVWLDQFQQELDRLRKPAEAERVRQIAHELALFRIDFFGPIVNEGEKA